MRDAVRVTVIVVAAAVAASGLAAQQRGGGRGMRPDRGHAVEPGEPCPAGMTLVRPGRCQAPELPPPSIVDYRPKSTVVAEEHLVPRAKFPVIDIHSHELVTNDNMAQRIKEMDALNLRVLVNLSGGSGDRLKHNVQTVAASPHKDRFRFFANVNFDGIGEPGWKEREVAALEQAIADGAIGLKIFKNLGLSARKADGSRLRVDDPDIDPLWQVCAARNVPVLIHTADPAQFPSTTPTNGGSSWRSSRAVSIRRTGSRRSRR
jgi:hypothetical protein